MIDIVIPTFNSSQYLDDCIDSLYGGRKYIKEVYVSDNLSNDSTREILLNKSWIRNKLKIVSRLDKGPASAINSAILMGNSELVGWINSDDYYSSGAIKRVVDEFGANRDIEFVYGHGRNVNYSGKDLGLYPTVLPGFNIDIFSRGCFISQPTVFFRRKIFERLGFLDESLNAAFDFDFWFRVFNGLDSSQVKFINKVQAYSRLHNHTITRNMRRLVAFEGMKVVSRHLGCAPESWALTYFNELCASYPFNGENESLEVIFGNFLGSIKEFMLPSDYLHLIGVIANDLRYKLSKRNVFANVQYDGWVSHRLDVRLKYGLGMPRCISLHCRGGWLEDVPLNLVIKSIDGSVNLEVVVSSCEEFILNLEAPEALVDTFYLWEIFAKEAMIPSLVNPKSQDNRPLSFQVLDLFLES